MRIRCFWIVIWRKPFLCVFYSLSLPTCFQILSVCLYNHDLFMYLLNLYNRSALKNIFLWRWWYFFCLIFYIYIYYDFLLILYIEYITRKSYTSNFMTTIILQKWAVTCFLYFLNISEHDLGAHHAVDRMHWVPLKLL